MRRRAPRGNGPHHPGRRSLQRRILAGVRPLVIVPVLIIGSLALGSLLGLARSAQDSLDHGRDAVAQDVTGRTARADAVAVARQVDRLLAERLDDVRTLAAAPSVRSAARRAAQEGDTLAQQSVGQLEQQYGTNRRLVPGSSLDAYLRSLVQASPAMAEIVVTERNGLTVVASGRPSDFVQRDEQWWTQAWETGLYIGDADVDQSATGPGLTIASRIDGNARRLGVVKGVMPIEGLQQIATLAADDTGSHVTIVTRDGRLVAESSSAHDPARMLTPDVELDDARAQALSVAVDDPAPGFDRGDGTVVGFASLSAIDGRVAALSDEAATGDTAPSGLVAVVERDDMAAAAVLDGLANVHRGLWGTVWAFGAIAALLLIAALMAATRVSQHLADGIVGPLRSLGSKARDIADHQLPALVTRAQVPAGDTGDLPVLETVDLQTGDEIEDVADAFNNVSGTAAELASAQARSRRNVARMFVSLGRRNQNLLGRQLEVIDRLERDTSDPDLLDRLFHLDHLATRMRRNAESLLVLAGEQPGRRWAEPVPVSDVVRGAIAEVEDYRRVSLEDLEEVALIGTAVGDVTHLLAELIENATRFSPPDTTVEVVGRRVLNGYQLSVVDHGVGMSAEQLQDANQRIVASPLADRVPSKFLGLFVVGRLAARHAITVGLRQSTNQGITATVLLPAALVDVRSRAEVDDRREPITTPTNDAAAASDAKAVPAVADADTASADASTSVDRPWPDDAAVTAEIDVRQVQAAAAASRATTGPATSRRGEDGALAGSSAGGGSSGEAASSPDAASSPAAAAASAPAAASPPEVRDEADAEAAAGVGEAAAAVAATTPDAEDVGGTDEAGDADGTIMGDASEADTERDDELPVFPRRPSRRRDASDDATHGSAGVSNGLRRTAPSTDDAPARGGRVTHPGQRSAAAATLSPVTDEQGVALTESEREARAARDRLTRFQQAVRRGRAHARGRRDGGEQPDA